MKMALYKVTFGFKDGEMYTDETALSTILLAEDGEEALANAKLELKPEKSFYLSSITCLARES